MVDGLPKSLGRVQPRILRMVENEVVNYAKASKRNAGQVVRDLRNHYAAEANQRKTARLLDFHAPEVLLAFLCQLTSQRWKFSDALRHPSETVSGREVRGVWMPGESACPSYQRELEGQPGSEYPDSLQELSSLLAYAASCAWGQSYEAHATECFPLTNALPRKHDWSAKWTKDDARRAKRNRIGRLKGYGNAIVPQLAAEFVGAYLTSRPHEKMGSSEGRRNGPEDGVPDLMDRSRKTHCPTGKRLRRR
jgi:hypothetical protein